MMLAMSASAASLAAAGLVGPGEGSAEGKPEGRDGKGHGKPPEHVDGIRCVFLPSPQNPLVALRIYFDIGSADDPKGKEGLAALTSDLLGQGGTTSRTYAEVLDALYPLAASIRVFGDRDTTVFEGMVHRDNLTAFADLLAAQLLEPRFAEDDFARNKQNARDYVTETLRGNDDEELGKQALASLMYEGHPYGHPTPGTVRGLDAITLDDVKTFYAKTYARDRLVVGVAGGYPEGFAETFAKRFTKLPAKAPARPHLPKPHRHPGLSFLLVDKKARANAISAGYVLPITRADDDFYPLTVARSYLGEHRTFNGVLMNHLRGDRGLNYGDYAYIENFIQDGWSTFPLPNVLRRTQHFSIWIRPVAPANTLFALKAALWETDKLVKEGIPEAGFAATKKFLLNYVNLWTQDVSRRLGFAIDARIAGKDIVGELKHRLPKLTKAEVDRVLKKYLQVKDMAVAIVTDEAEALKAKLLAGGKTPIVYDTEGTPKEILAQDALIEVFPLPAKPETVKVVPVGEMFQS
jgi:zinc protease